MASSRELAKVRARQRAAALDLNGQPAPIIREMIGRDGSASFWDAGSLRASAVDRTRTDYAFWDKLRNCAAEGYELSGLLCRPITQVLSSYIVGKAPTYTLVEASDGEDSPVAHTNDLLERFMKRNLAAIIVLVEDLHALGDQFVIVNPDGSLSMPPPDTVKVEYERWNPRRMERVTITTKDRGVVIVEEYTADMRRVTMRSGGQERVEVWDNLIGRLPVVHFANNRRSNELLS